MRDFLKVFGPLAAIALLGLFIALRYVDPAPPKQITFASGGQGGAYAAHAERYRGLLAEHGVRVEVLATAGSVENVSLLLNGDADVALVQGGIASASDGEALQSLGGMFYEPFWVFVRRDVLAQSFGDLKGARMAIGAQGSGTRMLAETLKREYGPGWGAAASRSESAEAAADALLAGQLDAAAFSASPDAGYIRRLAASDSVRILPFRRAPALARRSTGLDAVTLLRGVLDVGTDQPPEDVPMVASVAQLTVRKDLHPAIEAVLLEAASAIHSGGTQFAGPGSFPDGTLTDLELAGEARRYYERGPSFLRRVFPFAVANFLERAWVLAIPLLTLMIPLVRLAPPIYRWRVRRTIYIWYSDLRELESRGRNATTSEERDEVRRELSRLQEEIGRLAVPLSYTDDLYRLRNHVTFVNQLLGNLAAADD